jgi:hypothetical protein
LKRYGYTAYIDKVHDAPSAHGAIEAGVPNIPEPLSRQPHGDARIMKKLE